MRAPMRPRASARRRCGPCFIGDLWLGGKLARMKRRDLVKKLREAGFELREGANHTLVYRDGKRVSLIGRHREIEPPVIRAIEKQTGLKLT